MNLIPLLQNAAAGQSQSGLGMFIPLLLIIVIMYFFMIRPQNKKEKETKAMLSALKKGDKVVTIGGIRGTIFSVKEETVVVKVDDNTKLEFNRTAIATVIVDKPKTEATEEKPKKFSLFGKKKTDVSGAEEKEPKAKKAKKEATVEEVKVEEVKDAPAESTEA